jgi:outer membrane protein assembly factor BamB
MRRFALALTLVASALLAHGCAVNSTTSKNHTNAGPLLTDIDSSAKLGYRITWQSTLAMPTDERVLEVKPLGDLIAVRESGNIVTLVEEATGEIRWRKTVGKGTERLGSPVIVDEQLLVTTETRAYFLRLDNGALAGIIDLKRNARTTPLVMAGNMIYGGPSGRLVAQDLINGHPHWQYQMGSAISAQPLAMGGLLFVADESGGVAALNPAEGGIIWRKKDPPWDRITAQPAVSDVAAYVASLDQKLYAFERTSGAIYWQYLTEHPLTDPPIVLGEHVYQRAKARGLVCLDALTGEELWRSDVPGDVMQQTGETLVLRDGNTLRSVDVESGELIESAQWPKAEMIVPASVTGGPLYLAHPDGRIMKLSPR